MTAVLAPEMPVGSSPGPALAVVPEAPSATSSWLEALPRPADLTAAVGWVGEWLGHASLEPARVVLRREVPVPVARADVLDAGAPFGAAYAVAAAVAGGSTGLLGGVLGAGKWAPLVGVAAAFGVDTLLTTATCVRAVAHVGAHYGFVVRSDDERVEVLALVAGSLGGRTGEQAGGTGSGAAAPTTDDRRHLAALVVTRLSVHRAPTELVRLLPVVGPVVDAALGAVLGARLLARVVDDADRHYRARYLAERADAA